MKIILSLSCAIIFAMPILATGQDVNLLQEKLSRSRLASLHKMVYLRTDRDLYAPGDNIWFQAFVLDDRDQRPHTRRVSATLRLNDNTGNSLQFAAFTIVNGSGTGVITVPPGTKEGIYTLDIPDDEFRPLHRTTIGIRDRPLPSFLISMEVPDEKFAPGTDVAATLRFLSHSAEPLRKVSFEFYLNRGDGERMIFNGETDATGTFRTKLRIPAELPTGLLGFGVNATYRGRTEILHGSLNVASPDIVVRLTPEGGKLLAGVNNRIACQAVDGYGNAVPFSAEVLREGRGMVTAMHSDTGLGSFELNPDTGGRYHVRITGPNGTGKTLALPAVDTTGLSIRLKERKDSAIVIAVVNTRKLPVKGLLAVRNGARIIWSSAYNETGTSTFEIPMEGIGGFVDCVLLNERMEVESQRIVLWKTPDPLPVIVITDMQRYQPREKVRIGIDAQGRTPFIRSASASFQAWTAGLPDLNRMLLLSDPILDTLTMWSLAEAVTPAESDILTMFVRNTRLWNDAAEADGIQSLPGNLTGNRLYMLDTRLLYSARRSDGKVVYLNTKAGEYFLLGNRDYLRSLSPDVAPRRESYKDMLETGTPVRDVVRKIRPYDLDGNSIIFAGRRTSLIAQNGALIVLDGIKIGTSVALLDQIVPFDVERIFVSTDPQDIQRYTGLNSVGLIEITMKRGPPEEKKTPANKPTTFTSPEYTSRGRAKRGKDFRNTLFWNADPSGENPGSLEYYNGDLVGTVRLTLVLMDQEGRFGTAEVVYEIRL